MASRSGVVQQSAAEKAADFANYFCTYGFLYHQKDMLSDRVRMTAYHDAVFKNRHHFDGKVVLDVGTGSGILAIWAAQAGARKVYAVEATDMAVHARDLVQANGVADRVEVIQASVEEATLPEQVDVIISEWMGYFLVRESMFDSVILARDKWLKPGGLMYPSHASMYLAPVQSMVWDTRTSESDGSMADWEAFVGGTRRDYGVDMGVLTPSYREEQRKYFMGTACWEALFPSQVIARPAVLMEMDCHTATLEEVATVCSSFTMPCAQGMQHANAFGGWFDVTFKGNATNPAQVPVVLTTAPSSEHGTHWGQQVFLLERALELEDGDEVIGDIAIHRSAKNKRLMDVKLKWQVVRPDGSRTSFMEADYAIE